MSKYIHINTNIIDLGTNSYERRIFVYTGIHIKDSLCKVWETFPIILNKYYIQSKLYPIFTSQECIRSTRSCKPKLLDKSLFGTPTNA